MYEQSRAKRIFSIHKYFQVSKLFKELGLSDSFDLNEHETRIAMQFVDGNNSGTEWEEIGISFVSGSNSLIQAVVMN